MRRARFDLLLRPSECFLGTHGLAGAVKSEDWWCNAKLSNKTREAFGENLAYLFDGYDEDDRLKGTPTKFERSENRPIVLLVRKKPGRPVDTTIADAYRVHTHAVSG